MYDKHFIEKSVLVDYPEPIPITLNTKNFIENQDN